MAQGRERRLAERRQGQRRSTERGASDRRHAERRAIAGVALAIASLTVGAQTARADVYTRVNSKGVLEATDVPSQLFKLAYRSKGTLVHSAGFYARASSNTEFDALIDAAAALHGVRRDLVRAIIQVESDFDQLAVSTAGARGLMQLMPATARRLGVTDSFDARQNIFAGTRYLRILLDTYGEDVSRSAAAYNAGERAVARYGGIPPFRETQNYVRRVNALLGGTGEASVSVAPALFITPGETAPSAAQPAGPVVKRPRVHYRWKDAKGVVHLAQTPPATGEFTTIRSTD
jgi:hypothetical protein